MSITDGPNTDNETPDTLPMAVSDARGEANDLRVLITEGEEWMNRMWCAIYNATCVLGILERTIANTITMV